MRSDDRLLFAAVALFSCAAVAQAPAPAPQKLTLKQAETIAIANHPQIKAASFTAAAAEQVTTEVRSAYYPQVYGDLTGVDAQNGTRLAAGALNNPLILDRFASALTVGPTPHRFRPHPPAQPVRRTARWR